MNLFPRIFRAKESIGAAGATAFPCENSQILLFFIHGHLSGGTQEVVPYDFQSSNHKEPFFLLGQSALFISRC